MSKFKDIIDGKQAALKDRRSGLIYTHKCGWVDLGHARPDGAAFLWLKILKGNASLNRSYELTYSQSMARTKLGATLEAGISKSYMVKSRLTEYDLKSVALSIFLDVSNDFENFQASFVFKLATDSGYSSEDLISNLIGFYRAIDPMNNYITLCEPVSYEEAVYVWNTYGPVGAIKNRTPVPYLYPTNINAEEGPRCGQLPSFLSKITPAKKGKLFVDFVDMKLDSYMTLDF